MINDDDQIGRVLSRREVLKYLGAAGAAMLVGCVSRENATLSPTSTAAGEATSTATAIPATLAPAGAEPTAIPTSTPAATLETAAIPACIVRPEQTEGPYFVDEMLNRSDIRSDPADGSIREGIPLALAVNVSQINNSGCTPLPGAQVDIWHCDALGVYSDVQDRNFGSTAGQKFLRGYQVTDENGRVQFTTIYPGWYQGRTVHIHFKIRTDPAAASGYDFTSQLYFDDALSDEVFANDPYAVKGERGTRNANDGIFGNGGDQLTLQVVPAGDGYTATFDIGLQI